jgi:hypothetical protein
VTKQEQELRNVKFNWSVGIVFGLFFVGVIVSVGGPGILAGVAGVVGFVAGALQ